MNLHALAADLDLDCPVPFALTPRAHAALAREPRPPVVCLCGSTRFCDEFRRANLRLTLAGQIVLSIGCDTRPGGDLAAAREIDADLADAKTRLDELHKRKIDLADYVLVLNVGGYTGPSTRAEIAYARAHAKPVRYLELPADAPGPVTGCGCGCGCGYDDCAACAGYGWACQDCAAAFFGSPPEDGRCPACRTARQ
jgi:hypothetical protein